ncbi:MAG: hypothetical protein ACR2KS_10205 [Candidatus Eremiobacter antarcticus]|nr:hypothetical protein [Candidatus Eremiobacteraeota bacterium]MBC5808805.1 hypothetical protein [Candidatus Eremiobacteraeota bacterium]
MATVVFTIPCKVVATVKHPGSTRVKLTFAMKDQGNQSAACLAFEHDAAAIGDAYTGLAPGTACTLTVSVP